MGDLAKKTTHTSEALANFVEQFKGKVSLAAFLSAFADQIQDAENGSFELIDERTLAGSVGVQLDGLGSIIGADRDGLADDAYRIRLEVQILINSSSGALEEILEILSLLESPPIEIEELDPATIITTIFDIVTSAVELALIIAASRSAAVRSDLHYSLSPEPELFRFASGDTTESSSTQGFGNDAATTGGKFADAKEA